MLRVRLQDQQGSLLADTQVDERGAIAIEIVDGNIFLPNRGRLEGVPLDRPLQLLVNLEALVVSPETQGPSLKPQACD